MAVGTKIPICLDRTEWRISSGPSQYLVIRTYMHCDHSTMKNTRVRAVTTQMQIWVNLRNQESRSAILRYETRIESFVKLEPATNKVCAAIETCLPRMA